MTTYREGGRVTIGDREFIVPKANLAVARAVAAVQKEAVTSPEADGFLASAKVLHLLLLRASPALTVEELLELVDVEDLGQVLTAVQTAAGFARAAPGEAARP
jgi:hypothetical protein